MATMTLYNGAVSQGAYTVTVSSSGSMRYFTYTRTGMGADRTFDRVDIDGDTTIFGATRLPNMGNWPIGSTLAIYCKWYVDGSSVRRTGYSYAITITGFVAVDGISFNGYLLPLCGILRIIPLSGGIYAFDLRYYTKTYSEVSRITQFVAPVELETSATGKQIVTSSVYPGELNIPNDAAYTNCYISSAEIEPFGLGWFVNLHIDQSAYEPVF